MWLLYRVLILTAFFIGAGDVLAQTATTTPEQQAAQQAVLPAPPAAALNQMPTMAPILAPAPTIQPLLSPRDQAVQDQRQAAQASVQQQGTQQSPGIPANSALMPQQQVAPIAPQQQQQAIIAPPTQQPTQQQAIIAQPAPVNATPSDAQVAPIAATPTATAQTPNQPVTVQGYSPAMTSGNMPTTTGMMPITNAGIDMNLSPNIVGGSIDPTTGAPIDAVPYEVQLQQRTQELQQQARGIAFEQAKRSILAMEPYEIRDVLARLKDTQEAIQSPVRPAPKTNNVIRTISTDPGAKPHTIHLYAGNVTTINIIDVTGEPWPIVDYGFGGPFVINSPEQGGHVLRITPKKDFAHGNLVVRLLKLTTPITFSLEAGGDTVDYRFDARMPELGPNAKTPVIDEGIGMMAGDKTTMSFLEGVSPTGSEKVTVEGVDGRTSAYRFANSLYVRTPLSLLSPAWNGSATSSDGMNVYVLEDTPVLLLSDNGSLVRARLGQKTTSNISTISTSKE